MNKVTQTGRKLLIMLFISIAMLADTDAQQTTDNASSTLNLDNADIRVLINTVSEATGKNFIVDKRVKGKVTVVSSKAMNNAELYEVFLSILQVHGYSAVPGVGFVKIVPDNYAKQTAVPLANDKSIGPRDELVTRVIQINNAPANQLVPILRPLVPQQGHLAAYVPTNVLVITDRSANISRLVQVIRYMDKGDNKKVEVIPLENASASEIVRILNSLKQSSNKDGPGSKSKLIADDRSNSILVSGDKVSRQRMAELIKELDKPLESTGNTQVVFLRYADATEMAKLLTGIAQKAAQNNAADKKKSGSRNNIDIHADESNNALIITAPSAVTKMLQGIIRKLDIRRAQVLIEAIIAEVSTEATIKLGTQFFFDSSNGGKKDSPIGGSIFNGGTNILGLIGANTTSSDNDNTSGNLAGGLASGLTSGLTLGVGELGGPDKFLFILNALRGDGATNILSTPSIVTTDNKEAEIVFAQNIPVATGSFTNTGNNNNGASNPFQTFDRKDVGIILKVKPQINEGGSIKLEISQEISSVASNADDALNVTTNKRTIKTEVMIEDSQILVLGGLIEERFTDKKQKVPVLGSIPILGRLFSYNSSDKNEQNLMLFIRPVILHNKDATDYYTQAKYANIRKQQEKARIHKLGTLGNRGSQLPEIEALFTSGPDDQANTNDDDE